ncbi:hypothetical protein GCM10009609_53780 [Pseudonocardia aurantiaca]|uniref:PRC-barrel domain-containing protein n=1 Tax=Pseudonocardia aurantiaca TaxID=75290 RepID=A0ABW4FW85_9PSEU
MTQAIEWVTYRGMPLYDEDGNLIGTIEEFYIEADDAAPAWVVVVADEDETESTDGADGDATRSYVPVSDARRADDGRGLQVPVSGDTVRNAPTAQGEGDLSGDEERRLYEHYGQTYPGGDAGGADASDKSDGGSRKPGLLQRLLGRD